MGVVTVSRVMGEMRQLGGDDRVVACRKDLARESSPKLVFRREWFWPSPEGHMTAENFGMASVVSFVFFALPTSLQQSYSGLGNF